MRGSRKFMVLAVLGIVVLVGTMTGVVLAQNAHDNQPEARPGALLERICAIYEQNTGIAIDPEALRDAFIQARTEMREEALQNRLQYLVEQGKITQKQADQYLEWWQSKPDVPVGLGFRACARFHDVGALRS